MLLKNKNAVIYGASGAVGSAVARTFAREGARLFLTGRDLGARSTQSPRRSLLPAARLRPPRSTLSTRTPSPITSTTSLTKPRPSISRSTPSGFRSKACKAFP